MFWRLLEIVFVLLVTGPGNGWIEFVPQQVPLGVGSSSGGISWQVSADRFCVGAEPQRDTIMRQVCGSKVSECNIDKSAFMAYSCVSSGVRNIQYASWLCMFTSRLTWHPEISHEKVWALLVTTMHSLILDRHGRKPWSKFINADNQHLVAPEVCRCVASDWIVKICIGLEYLFWLLLHMWWVILV